MAVLKTHVEMEACLVRNSETVLLALVVMDIPTKLIIKFVLILMNVKQLLVLMVPVALRM
jgi:hypothetical protein